MASEQEDPPPHRTRASMRLELTPDRPHEPSFASALISPMTRRRAAAKVHTSLHRAAGTLSTPQPGTLAGSKRARDVPAARLLNWEEESGASTLKDTVSSSPPRSVMAARLARINAETGVFPFSPLANIPPSAIKAFEEQTEQLSEASLHFAVPLKRQASMEETQSVNSLALSIKSSSASNSALRHNRTSLQTPPCGTPASTAKAALCLAPSRHSVYSTQRGKVRCMQSLDDIPNEPILLNSHRSSSLLSISSWESEPPSDASDRN